ncbi:MAG: alcohol dehydrogenase catalytic domain-containing protein, partial [Gammaproteobacteria bacterium]
MQQPAQNKPATMKAVVTTGNGGYDRLVWCDVPVPTIGPGEVLLRVLAAGVNNTEINTRLGWYSSSVTTATNAAAAAEEERPTHKPDGGWNIATPFPFIQGTDCCGRVVATAPDVDPALVGRRVLVRACMRPRGFSSMDNIWMGSDFDGAFAEFVKVPAAEVFEVRCDWTDAELASIPCAYATAENMLHRARAMAGEHVLVTGASGGVGSAAGQLARRRGARVTAIAAASKADAVRARGAERVIDRDADAVALLGEGSVDIVVDNVAGSHFGAMLKVLRRGGRYAS